MYANTAYEALYQLIGLQFQETVTEWITSQVMFRALILLLFGSSFFIFLVHFASRYIPFAVAAKRAPLSRVILLVFCLFIGISLLKVDGQTTSMNMRSHSWTQNPYITRSGLNHKDHYRVSYIFKILSSSAEEIARVFGFMIDASFSTTNPQMTAPNFFFKALLGAAADTIDDPALRTTIDLYTDECLSKALPNFNPANDDHFIDRYFSLQGEADNKLAQISLEANTYGPGYNCLELKRSVNQSLREYAHHHSSLYQNVIAEGGAYEKFRRGFGENYDNWVASSLLVNHYLEGHEGALGMEKGTELPGTGGRIFQFLNRAFSMEGLLSIFNSRDMKGASVAAARSQELSDHLARAPHVSGFLRMLLIGFFPVLVFFLAAGRWKPLVWWWLTYLSICMWTPLWNLLYHVMTTLTLNLEVMQSFGRLADGLSLYASSLISSRLYQVFAVYSYLQLIIGPLFTAMLLRCMGPVLADSQPDSLPSGISAATSVASKAAGGLL